MKSLCTLALVGLTTLLIGCSSSDSNKSTASGTDLPVPANTTTTSTVTTSTAEPLPVVQTDGAVIQSTTTTTTSVATIDYTVVSGDSLWKIARDHRTSVAKIKSINGLTNDKLMPGQVIKVPAAQ